MQYLLTQSVENSARYYAEKIAFRAGKDALTYAELHRGMNCLANFLRVEASVKRGDRVGVFLNRCLDNATAIYGIMKMGGVYVPLDPGLPAERITYIIQDCGIKTVISNKQQLRRIKQFYTTFEALDHILGLPDDSVSGLKTSSWETITAYDATPLSVEQALAEDPAYLLYTSGSTGRPKGILHSHYSGLAYAQLAAQTFALTADDIIGNHARLSFDISTFGYFAGPLVGATTVIATDAHLLMPASLAKLIRDEAISVWYSVPLALIQMHQASPFLAGDYPHLREVLYAGEPFPVKHLRSIMLALPNARFTNVYGPTETNQCTHYHLPAPPEETAKSISIGQVWGNTEAFVIDEDGQPVKIGEEGELVIRSATRMLGYWNDPEKTKKTNFRYRKENGLLQDYYRTGDIVRLGERLELVGRIDRQVKTRGYRVELDDVESALLSHPLVREAASFARQNKEEIKEIHAAVLMDGELTEAALKTHLKTKLPAYAIPITIAMPTDFPRTATGKINRRALAETPTYSI